MSETQFLLSLLSPVAMRTHLALLLLLCAAGSMQGARGTSSGGDGDGEALPECTAEQVAWIEDEACLDAQGTGARCLLVTDTLHGRGCSWCHTALGSYCTGKPLSACSHAGMDFRADGCFATLQSDLAAPEEVFHREQPDEEWKSLHEDSHESYSSANVPTDCDMDLVNVCMAQFYEQGDVCDGRELSGEETCDCAAAHAWCAYSGNCLTDVDVERCVRTYPTCEDECAGYAAPMLRRFKAREAARKETAVLPVASLSLALLSALSLLLL